jgi:hypothetical protein
MTLRHFLLIDIHLFDTHLFLYYLLPVSSSNTRRRGLHFIFTALRTTFPAATFLPSLLSRQRLYAICFVHYAQFHFAFRHESRFPSTSRLRHAYAT